MRGVGMTIPHIRSNILVAPELGHIRIPVFPGAFDGIGKFGICNPVVRVSLYGVERAAIDM